ncbi:MAG: AAA family ATPase [Myxococcota bacterium]
MEHLEHFGLKRDPFQNEPDLRFYFDSTSHRDAQRRVERALRQSKGLCLLCGESGTGKSLLARRILEGLEDEIFEASLLVMLRGSAGAASLMKRFARQLDISDPNEDQAGLMVQVYEKLAMVREDGRHTVLIIDDAQLMGAEPMAEVGTLLNFEYDDRRLLSLLLVGTGELEEALVADTSLAPRVDVRVRLQPMDEENASAYLAYRIGVVGGQSYIIPQEGVDALFKGSGGRPRLINTLADNGLFEAFLAGRPTLSAQDVERAAADLGIVPGDSDPAGKAPGRAANTPAASDSAPARQPQRPEPARPRPSPQPAPDPPYAVEITQPIMESVLEAAPAEPEVVAPARVEPIHEPAVVFEDAPAQAVVFEAESLVEADVPFASVPSIDNELQRAAELAAEAVGALQDDAPDGEELEDLFIDLVDD